MPPTNHKNKMVKKYIRDEVHDCCGLDNHQHCINNVYAAVCRDAAIKLFDLLLKPEGTTKDVPFKRRKVMGRRKDIGEARGRQDWGSLLQIYNVK